MDMGTYRRRLLISVDARGYGTQNDRGQFKFQAALIDLLDRAADRVGLDRQQWLRQPAGDGELSVLPDSADESTVIDGFVSELAFLLDDHNHDLVERARLRLRMAIHHGPVSPAAAGFAGQGVVVVSRIADSDALRSVLSAAPEANLVLALTTRIFDETVAQQTTRLRVRDCRLLPIANKAFTDEAWVYVPGLDVHALALDPVVHQPPARPSGPPDEASETGRESSTAPTASPTKPSQQASMTFHGPVDRVVGISNTWEK